MAGVDDKKKKITCKPITVRRREVAQDLELLKVIILYDSSEAAFFKSAGFIADMYRNSGGFSVSHPFPADEGILQTLAENQDDRLLVHYIGHGRNDDHSEFPLIQIRLDAAKPGDERLGDASLMSLHETSEDRSTLIIIYDCCNKRYQGEPSAYRATERPGMSTLSTYQGTLFLTSSRVDEYSYYLPDNTTLFTLAFERCISQSHRSLTAFCNALNDELIMLLGKYNCPVGDIILNACTAHGGSGAKINILSKRALLRDEMHKKELERARAYAEAQSPHFDALVQGLLGRIPAAGLLPRGQVANDPKDGK